MPSTTPWKRSRYRGVVANRGQGGPWLAAIRSLGGTIYLGPFETETEAARAYDAHFKKVPGFRPHNLNFPPHTARRKSTAKIKAKIKAKSHQARPKYVRDATPEERAAILDESTELLDSGIHPSTIRLRELLPSISTHTIQRTLRELREGGEIEERPHEVISAAEVERNITAIREQNARPIREAEAAERRRLDRLRRGREGLQTGRATR